jgi:thioredoxin 2
MNVECSSCGRLNRVPPARVVDRAHCAACKGPLLPLAGPIALRTAEEFEELVRSAPVPVLVDFWAAWCGPCRVVAPELEKLARERTGSLVVAKVDTDALPDVAGRFRIQSIPTLVLLRGGHEDKRVAGAMPASAIASSLAL